MSEEQLKDLNSSNVKKQKHNFKGWIILIFAFLLILLIYIGTTSSVSWDWAQGAEITFNQILVNNFLGVTPLLLGIITFVGYLALKRGIVQSFLGFMKTVIGVIVMTIGSSTISEMSKPLFERFSKILGGTNVVSLDPYFGWLNSQNFLEGSSVNFGTFAVSAISFSLVLGLIINVLMVIFKKITNMRAIMITGHVMFQQSATFTAITFLFICFALPSVNLSEQSSFYPMMIGTILISGVSLGLYWATSCSAASKPTNKVTNNAGFTLGHQQMIGACIASKIGKYFGDSKDSAENKKLSRKFKIFEDNIFTQLVIVFALFFVIVMVIQFSPSSSLDKDIRFSWIDSDGKQHIIAGWEVAKGAHWALNSILGPFKFVGALLVLTTGVRMFVTELQQSFQGIVNKVVKEGIVAVDVAATYGFSPNSVTYGFLSGTISQFIAMAITLGLSFIPNSNVPIVVPLFITLFFNSGAIGVYANSTGGWKAAVVVPAIMGFVEVLVIMTSIMIINIVFSSIQSDFNGAPSPIENGYLGMFDWSVFFGITYMFMGIPYFGVWLAIGILWATLIIWAQFIKYDDKAKNIPIFILWSRRWRRNQKNIKLHELKTKE